MQLWGQRLLAARADDTVLLVNNVFDVGWRDAPHRVLRNGTVAAWEDHRPAAERQPPGRGRDGVAHRGNGRALVRYGDDPPIAGDDGDVAEMALYCGQGVGLIDRVEPAATIVAGSAPPSPESPRRSAPEGLCGGGSSRSHSVEWSLALKRR